MTTGYSGSFAINGTDLFMQPTEHGWSARNQVGTDGYGHPIYSGVRQYEMKFNNISTTDFNQLQGFYNYVGNTGTVSVDLPLYGNAGYQFYRYTGCVIYEPVMTAYFDEFHSNVTLLITNIR